MSCSISLSFVLVAAALISMLHVQHVTARRRSNGDATLTLYKDAAPKQQLNIFLGDQFIVDVKLRSGGVGQYNDLSFLNITQYLKQSALDTNPTATGNVTAVLERVENNLFNVTSVSPVNVACGGNATTLSRTVNYPHNYVTDLTLRNGQNATLTTSKVLRLVLSSHRIVTNTGIKLIFLPNP